MGLDVYVKYNEEEDDYSYYDYGFHTSYSGYGEFMEEILRYFGVTRDIPGFYFKSPDTDYPATDLAEIAKLQTKKTDDSDFRVYADYLKELEKDGLLDLVPLVSHSDCDGTIPWELAEKLLVLLDTDGIRLWFKLESEWEDTFLELLDTLKNAVENKGTIVYS